MKVALVVCGLLLGITAVGGSPSDEIAERSRAKGECLLHHVKLTDVTLYDYSGHEIVAIDLSNKGAKLWEKYPNAAYPVYRPKPEPNWMKPIVVRCCPLCQRKLQEGLEK